MTEELKQEAEEYISDNCERWEFDGLTVDDIANETYLAGAESREKQIADLEKENKVLTQNLEDTEIINKALEKENAELKEKVNILDNCDRLGDMITEAYKDQLTKAKELLNEFLDFESSCMERGIYISDKIRTEAKQFLNEVEE